MTHAKAKPCVLVVDDYADGREMVSEYLVFRGFQVVEARDGQEAIDLAIARKPDIILMDLQMKGMDGWEATRRLKANAATKNIVIVAFTAHALRTEVQTAHEAGCDAVIPKPYDLGLLAEALFQTHESGAAAFDRPGLTRASSFRGRKLPGSA